MGENADDTKPSAISAPVEALQKAALTLAGVLAAITQLWLAVQQQWQIAAVTLILLLVVVSLYFLFFRRWAGANEQMRHIVRWSAIAALIGIPIAAMLGLIAYSYLPRINGTGNTVAVSTFAGPPLPHPYEKCRPSEVLVRTLADVRDVFGHINVFEVPYSIDPDGRFAALWARGHGLLDGADAIVYGNFTLAKSNPALSEADLIVLDPRIDAVPRVSTADKAPPLYAWTLQRRTEAIADLCGGAAPGNDAAPFPDDARRLALALVGADLFASQNFARASDALQQARDTRGTANACDDRATRSSCGGVLAFYLGDWTCVSAISRPPNTSCCTRRESSRPALPTCYSEKCTWSSGGPPRPFPASTKPCKPTLPRWQPSRRDRFTSATTCGRARLQSISTKRSA